MSASQDDPWKGIKKYWATVTDRMRGAEQFYAADAVDAARAADAEERRAVIVSLRSAGWTGIDYMPQGVEWLAQQIATLRAQNADYVEQHGKVTRCLATRTVERDALRSTVDQQQARITALETDLMNQIDNSVALAHTVQAREARITELETALKDLLIAVTFAHTVEFTPENHCWEARVPVAFVGQARQALETP